MTWFMDPMPDGDTVHQVAASMRTVQGNYNPHIQTVQTTHDQTVVVWSGNDSTAHTQVTNATQQASQEHAGWLVALADTFQVLGTLLKVIFVLQMAWLAIQAATVVWGIFTAGLDALVTEGPAAALAVVIQGMRQAVVSLLTALAKALASRLVQAGVLIGGATGLGVGINTVESQHLSGWQAFLTIAGDTFTGAGAGMTIALDPLALAGTGVGVGQVATQSALGNPTDAQSAFNLITFDTFAASGFDSGGPTTDDPYAGDGLTRGKGDPRWYDYNKDGEGAFYGDDTLPYQPDGVKNARVGQNYDGSCVSASGRIILNDHGIVIPENDMMSAAGVDPHAGGNISNLVDPIKNYGGPSGVYGDSYTIADLQAGTANGQSAIVAVNPAGFNHALVVDGIVNTDTGPMVLIRDPLPYGFDHPGSAYQVPLNIFEQAWRGKAIIFP